MLKPVDNEKRTPEELIAKRNLLFQRFLVNLLEIHLAIEIKAVDDQIAECTQRDHTQTIADDELLEYYTPLLRDADLLVYGRKTYQLMVPYWPDVAKDQSETQASREFAKTFVSKNKIVFSQSLDSAEDKNTKIVRTNLQDEIVRLAKIF